jgi:glycosyltransferase involved in cell wall biosynthesis
MNKHSLNILLIASWYPSKENPTAGSFVQEQAHMLRDFGHQVTVIHPFMLGTFANAITKQSYQTFSDEDGIRVLRVGVAPPMPFFRGISYAYCFQRVRIAMKKFQLDPKDFKIIHSHAMFMGGVIGHKLSKENNLPQVHTEHTSGLIFNPKQYTKKDIAITRKAYSHCHKVLFVSDFALKHTLANIALKSKDAFVVLPNIVDSSFFSSEIGPLSKATSLRFLVIGNFIPRKNHQLLLEAFGLVQKEFPTVGLSIAANGPLENHLRTLCESLNLENVHWLPILNRAEVKEQMSAHHVILSTSKVETFGLTIAEAQAMGKPVVVTDSGGVRDIVTQETGIVTELSSEAFANGLMQLIQTFHTYDPETIRQSAKNRFAAPVIMNQLNEIYRQLHDGNLYL